MGEETRDRIVTATYRALCEHGYAALTIQDIADECDCSTALVHYHYDTKEDLLVALLEDLLDRFEERVAACEGPPRDRLVSLVELLLFGDDRTTDAPSGFSAALLELRAQARHNDAFRAQLAENDALVHATVTGVLEQGIESGDFRPVDAERTAEHLLAAVRGARTRWVTLEADAAPEAVYRALVEDVIDGWLVDR